MRVRFSKLLSAAAWALGATAASTAFSQSASAVEVTCNTNVTSEGSSSLTTPTDVGNICNATTFSVEQSSTPAYWEFAWTGTNPVDIHSTVNTGSFGGSFGGSFYGTLDLYNSSDSLLASSGYNTESPGDFITGTTEADIDTSLDGPPAEYILGVTPSGGGTPDPFITVSFASPVPEPATFGLFAGALGLLALFRWRRRKA